ncbi:MAG: TIGR04282 family arsenosugar biosynthesis glycosyltransferase [Nitrospirae bacterium]|nr:TIGR04282 family arsenosugar biosynthesis glycosyltransferase [Nitrospirota bacterium]
MNNRSALGIFFRIPEYGKVKTRLAKEIGKHAALNEYKLMLCSTVYGFFKLNNIDFYGFYEGTIPKPDFLKILTCLPQKGSNLGDRMLNAFEWLFRKGYKKTVITGSDIPDLPLDFLREAFKQLDFSDLTIGPSEDGGYYLIGMKKPVNTIFENITWGSDSVLDETVSIADREGIRYSLLPRWYDIDDFAALKRWKKSLKYAKQI